MSSLIDNDPTRIYVNLNACAGSALPSTPGADLPTASYVDSRGQFIVERANKYKLSVLRLVVSGCGSYFPLGFCPVQSGQSDVNLSVWGFTPSLTWTGQPGVFPDDSTELTLGSLPIQFLARTQSKAAPYVAFSDTITSGTAYANSKALATAITTALAASTDPIISKITASINTSGCLSFALATGAQAPGVAFAFVPQGFAFTLGLPLNAQTQTLWSDPTSFSITMPNICANPPTYPVTGRVLTWTSTPFTQYLTYVNEDESAPQPAPPLVQQTDSSYYWMYSFQRYCDMFNAASQQAMATLQAQFAEWWTAQAFATPCPGLQTQAPTLSYNATTKLFKLQGDPWSCGPVGTFYPATGAQSAPFYSPTPSEEFSLTLLEQLADLFLFPAQSYDAVGSTIVAWDASGACAQEFGTTPSWSPVQSVVLLTSLITTLPEAVAPAQYVGESLQGTLGASESPSEGQITDVALTLDSASDYRGFQIYYAPSAEYRWIELTSSQPIRQLDLRLAWRSRWGTVTPVVMPPNSSFSAKILLQRKDIP